MGFRLLAQLDETENAFEQFWSKHELKLEQCLQLRHFEQDFRDVSSIHTSLCFAQLATKWIHLESAFTVKTHVVTYSNRMEVKKIFSLTEA